MDQKLREQFDGLLTKYTELLLGEADDELKEKVQMWALYTYMSKSMPPLVKHWNDQYPDAKEGMKELIQEIREHNEEYRNEQKK
ncbi:YusU family protein [Pseudalkalibacillus salsuginis]|uniref:YusU family protein n=1 Tax=Pseudalkalibacillus salsuginis TaxID=2910972 RepID=UPI001CD1C882|nr:YusU family protein [Pseudalkalibacillus salsuginis]MCF6410380.1 YusU family protein [Pseudalkalibacillus salsuginis]